MSRTTMKINIAEYQVQGFISARSGKGMDYQKARATAAAAIGDARSATPIALQESFYSYLRFVRGPEGGFEYGWLLR